MTLYEPSFCELIVSFSVYISFFFYMTKRMYTLNMYITSVFLRVYIQKLK